jgi:type IV secretory pathway VirJ component
MHDVNTYLNERAEDLMVYKMPRNKNLMDEIFAFNPMNLDATPSAKLSMFAIGLAQFLIYFTSQINKSRVKLMQKERQLELYITQSPLKGKTKSDKRAMVIEANHELQQIVIDIEALEAELKMTENLEKYYVEIINSLKRELTRREVEMKFTRDERRL